MFSALTAIIAFVAGAGLVLLIQRQPFLPIPDKGHRDFMVPDRKALEDLSAILGNFRLKPTWRIDDKNPRGIHRVVFNDKKTTLAVLPEYALQSAGNPAANISLVVRNPATAAARLVTLLQQAGYQATDHGQLADELNEGSLHVVSTSAASGWVFVLRKWGPKMGQMPTRYK